MATRNRVEVKQIRGGRLATDAGILVCPRPPRFHSDEKSQTRLATMQVITATEAAEHDGYLALHYRVMNEIGELTRTFAAVRELANKKNKQYFGKLEHIQGASGLPLRTTKRHLEQLTDRDWLKRWGRQRRRTVTYEIREHAWKKSRESFFGRLPNWWTETSWARSAVYATILGLRCKVEAVDARLDVGALEMGSLEHLELITKTELWRKTGLSERAIVYATNWLQDTGYVRRIGVEWKLPTFEILRPPDWGETVSEPRAKIQRRTGFTNIQNEALKEAEGVNRWIAENFGDVTEETRLNLHACSVRALAKAKDNNVGLFLTYVKIGREQGFAEVVSEGDLQAASSRLNRALNAFKIEDLFSNTGEVEW